MDLTTLFSSTPVQHVNVEGTRLAFRTFGNAKGVPLVLFNRFRGCMEDWDPAVISRLSSERRVVIWDNAGLGSSQGAVQENITQMAKTASAFVDELELKTVDILGFSVGGYIAQRLALLRSDLVRNVILAGTGPGGGEGATYPGPDVEYWVRPEHSRFDALQGLWFNQSPEGKAATQGYLERIYHAHRPPEAKVTDEAGAAQRAAILKWWGGEGSTISELGEVKQPVLIVNGNKDIMVPTPNSFLMAQRISNAQLIIYPNAGHGSLFQYPETFSTHALQFLAAQEQGGLR